VSGAAASPAGAGKSGRADRYLLGDSTAEVEHLTRQAEVYADEFDAQVASLRAHLEQAGHADRHGGDVAGLGHQAVVRATGGTWLS
jgi:hypothetical protein